MLGSLVAQITGTLKVEEPPKPLKKEKTLRNDPICPRCKEEPKHREVTTGNLRAYCKWCQRELSAEYYKKVVKPRGVVNDCI